MRVFVAEDLGSISEQEREAIGKWAEKNDVINTAMVLSNEVADGVGVVTAYEALNYLSFSSPQMDPDTVYEGANHPSAFIKIAEFSYDDFPWPEGF